MHAKNAEISNNPSAHHHPVSSLQIHILLEPNSVFIWFFFFFVSAKNQNRFLRFWKWFFVCVCSDPTHQGSGCLWTIHAHRKIGGEGGWGGVGRIAHNINECVDTILYSFIIIWLAYRQRLVHGKCRTPMRNRYDRIKWMLFMRCSTYVYPLTAHPHNINRRCNVFLFLSESKSSFSVALARVDGTMCRLYRIKRLRTTHTHTHTRGYTPIRLDRYTTITTKNAA